MKRMTGMLAAALGADIRVLRSEIPAPPKGRPVAFKTAQEGVIEFVVTGDGRGYSVNFTKGQCLFCTEFKAQAERGAEARARGAVEQVCTARKGFLKGIPEIVDTNCMRVDGWVSYYVCGAQASATCIRVLADQ